jgi:hypothetical protein
LDRRGAKLIWNSHNSLDSDSKGDNTTTPWVSTTRKMLTKEVHVANEDALIRFFYLDYMYLPS